MLYLIQYGWDATAELDAPHLAVRGGVEGGRIRIDFHDNGPGIDPAKLAQVFDPFFTTKPVGKGTGLGLAISYGIVERHGGRLSVANHPAGGAVFSVELPAISA
jgi:two-component system sensor histidine kinase HupT/HoxJ